MPLTIEELKARQDEIRSRVTELDKEFAGREFSADTKSEWERIEEEFERNAQTIAELEFRRERVEAIAGNPENRDEAPASIQTRRSGVARGAEIYDLSTIRSSVASPEEATRELRERAMRSVEREDFAHEEANREAIQAHIERMIAKHDGSYGEVSRRMLLTGNPTYRKAFAKFVSGQMLSPEEQRAMSLAGEDGGFALPYTLDPTFTLTSNGVINPIREIADVKQIATNTWRGVNTAGVEARYEGEAEEAADGSPKLAQPEVDAHRCTVFVPFSYEYGQDFGSLEAELAMLTQDAKDVKEASAFLTGNGEKQPFGLLVGATEVVLTGTKEAFLRGDLYTLKGALGARFRANAAWLAADAIYDRVRQFDTQGGADLWVRLGEDRPPELIGKPAYELSTMDSAVDNTEKKVLIYGDFKNYVIADRIGMGVKLIPDLFGENGRPTGESGFYAFWRNGGKVRTKTGFRILKVKKE